MRSITLYLLPILLIIFTISGCGVSQTHYRNVERKLSAQDYEGAVKVIKKGKKNEYGKKNRLLYYMNLGWAYHLSGNTKDAQASFEMADQAIGDLFTKKTSQEIGSMVSNDNALPFVGEDFEKIILTIFRGIDFAFHGKGEDARVEIRKVENRLKFLADERQKNKQKHSTYKWDAYAYYLSGLIYELDQEFNNAYISYYKAYKSYKLYRKAYKTAIPEFVKKSVMRYAEEYASSADLPSIQRELGAYKQRVLPTADYAKKGQLVFIHYNGYAPRKKTASFTIRKGRYGQKRLKDIIHMAYPIFKLRKHRVAYATVSVNEEIHRVELVEPIDRIAIIDLKDRLGRIWQKMIVRRVVKYLASEVAGKASGDKTLGAIFHLASNLSEQADLRSWRVIPAEIGMIPITLEPGTYNATMTLYSRHGTVIQSIPFNNLEVKSGQKLFKLYRSTM